MATLRKDRMGITPLRAIAVVVAVTIICAVALVSVIGVGPGVRYMPGVDEKNVTHYVQASVQMWMAETAHGVQAVRISHTQGNITAIAPHPATMFETQEGVDVRVVVVMAAPDGSTASVQQQFSHAQLEAHTYVNGQFIAPWYEVGTPFGVSESGIYKLTFSILHNIGGAWTETPVDGDSGPLVAYCFAVVP